MMWVWVLTLLILIGIGLLLRPLQLSISSAPWAVQANWWGVAYHWSTEGKNQLKILFFPLDLNKNEKKPKTKKQKTIKDQDPAKSKAKSKKKGPPRFAKPTFALAKITWQSPYFKKIVLRLLYFLKAIIRCFRLHSLHGTIGSLDFFQTGVLKGLLYNLPQGKRLQLDANFIGEEWFIVKVHFVLWRFVAQLIWLPLSLPYLSLWRLYKIWLNPARI